MGQAQGSQLNKDSQNHDHYVNGHPLFKNTRLLNGKQGELIQLQVQANEVQLTAWEKNFRALLPCDFLFLPLSFAFQRTAFCGNNGVCRINFDNYPFLLIEEISNRRAPPGKLFEEKEVWYLLLSLVEAAKVAHGKGEKIGDVRPANVFMNESGHIKVASQHSWPHELDNYQKTFFEKQPTFLAPEEIKDLHFGLTESKSEMTVAEAFSIGLTILDSTLLTDSTDLYSVVAFRIDYTLLEQRRQTLRVDERVSQVLRETILALTEADPKERLTCKIVCEWLQQYREKIINMEPFQVGMPPWTKQQIGLTERKSVQIIKPPSQLPFPNDPKRFQQVLYEQSRSNYDKQPQWSPPVLSQLPSEPFRVPLAQTIGGVYESSYVQVPAPGGQNIGKVDDFRSTLQKIDQQLAISRKMFPN